MIRILHSVTEGMSSTNGLASYVISAYRTIDRSKVQFDFIVGKDCECTYDKEIHELGGNIYYIPKLNKGILKRKKALDEFFTQHKEYNILHCHVSSLVDITVLEAAKKHGVPTRIVHSQNTHERLFFYTSLHLCNRLFLDSLATDIFACSPEAAKWMCGKKRFEKGEYKVFNNAIETDKFLFSSFLRNKKRDEFNLDRKYVVGHIGRFEKQKNHSFLIDIFKCIHDNNPNAVLLLIGDGPLKSQIQNKVRRLSLEGSVIFAGVRDDVNELLNAMDVFLFPSKFEGLGIVLIEAQANGLTCFASDTVPKLANAINTVHFLSLDSSAGKWAETVLGTSYDRIDARQMIEDSGFDAGKLAKNLEDFYTARSCC